MAASPVKAKEFLHISKVEEESLLSKERPIVILKERNHHVSRLIAPGLTFHGLMLPYTPFQHLLFHMAPEMILVMTSANLSEEPIPRFARISSKTPGR